MFSRRLLLLPALLFVGVFALYVHNLSRSVYGGDVGDLLTAASVFGVAHPPGYPLFTFLGFLLSRLPLGQTAAFNIGLISAVSGSTLTVFFFLISRKLTKNDTVSLLSSLIAAFSYFVWFYSEIAEVFMLNSLFAVSLFYLALKLREKWNMKLFWFFCFILGLSCTNHQTTILVIPSLIILLWPRRKQPYLNDLNHRTIIYGILFLLLGFSFYLYVPIAASRNPVINWDNVHDIPSFVHLLLRKDYGTFRAGPFDSPIPLQRVVLLKIYAVRFLTQLTIPVLLFCILGIVHLFRKDRNFLLAVITGVLLSGPVFIAYAGFPPYSSFFLGVFERFFLLSFVFFLLLLPFGFVEYLRILDKTFLKKYTALFLFVLFLIPALLFHFNFPKTDLSGVFIGDYLGIDSLAPLPKNSILISAGDTLLFNTEYVHYVLKVRPDVLLLNANDLAKNTYVLKKKKELTKNNPNIPSEDQIARTIEYIEWERPVFSALQIQAKYGNKLTWVPYGLNYMLVRKDEEPSREKYAEDAGSIWKSMHMESHQGVAYGNLSISDIPATYSDALLATGNYFLLQYQATAAAGLYYGKAKSISSTNAKVYLIQGLNYMTANNCKAAEDELKKAIEYDTLNMTPYFFLYGDYTNCYQNPEAAEAVVKQFKGTFSEDLRKALSDSFKKNHE